MKLTKYIREGFVRAVMDDVPSVDYDEKAGKLIRDYIAQQFAQDFPGIKWENVAEKWFEHESNWTPGSLTNVYALGPRFALDKVPELWTALTVLSEQKQLQAEAYNSLERKLEGVVNSVTTLAKLREALPEFTKYMPEETATTRSLPVIQNVVADFVKAGWPKGAAA